MRIVNKSAPMLENIYKKIMKKAMNPKMVTKDEFIIKVWHLNGKKIKDAQIYGEKVLPNGNMQRRITTVYGNNGTTIATDTRVYSPNGELLKAYHGLRGNAQNTVIRGGKIVAEQKETRAYGSNSNLEIANAVKAESEINPDAFYIRDFL